MSRGQSGSTRTAQVQNWLELLSKQADADVDTATSRPHDDPNDNPLTFNIGLSWFLHGLSEIYTYMRKGTV